MPRGAKATTYVFTSERLRTIGDYIHLFEKEVQHVNKNLNKSRAKAWAPKCRTITSEATQPMHVDATEHMHFLRLTMPRGAKATTYVFTSEQLRVIDDYIHLFEKEVQRVNKNLNKNNTQLTTWKNEAATKILATDAFNNLLDSDTPLASWSVAIKRKFTNHFNNVMRRKQPSHSPLATEEPSSSGIESTEKATNTMLRALSFGGNLTARRLFQEDMKDEILAVEKEMLPTYPHLKGGALHSKATAELWEKVDQAVWEEKAKVASVDVAANQNDFPYLMADALQGMCNRNMLGSCVFSMSYGFRDENDGVISGTIYAGFDTETEMKLTSKIDGHDDWEVAWDLHVDRVLPRKPSAIVGFDLNDEGIPLFPQVDIWKMPVDDVAKVVETYLMSLWNIAATSKSSGSLPWRKIELHPDAFYDTEMFNVPISIKLPTRQSMTPTDILLLAEYFGMLCHSGNPFRFRLQRHNDISSSQTKPLPATTTDSEHQYIGIPMKEKSDKGSPFINDLCTPAASASVALPTMGTLMTKMADSTASTSTASRTGLLVMSEPDGDVTMTDTTSSASIIPIPGPMTIMPALRLSPTPVAPTTSMPLSTASLSLPITGPHSGSPPLVPKSRASTSRSTAQKKGRKRTSISKSMADTDVCFPAASKPPVSLLPPTPADGAATDMTPEAKVTIPTKPVANVLLQLVQPQLANSEEPRRSSRKRKQTLTEVTEPVAAPSSLPFAKRVKPSWTWGTTLVDNEGHPLDAEGNRLK